MFLRKLGKIRDTDDISSSSNGYSREAERSVKIHEQVDDTLQCIVVLTRLQLIACCNAPRDNRSNRMNYAMGSRRIESQPRREFLEMTWNAVSIASFRFYL